MRTAIVCMSHCPHYLEDWVNHHADLGFDRIYLRIEGEKTADYLRLFRGHRIVRVLEYQFYPIGNQMDRQGFLVNSAIEKAREENIDFLLHIDDDELFYLPSQTLQEFLSKHKRDKDYLHFQNIEAVYPPNSLGQTCFQRTKFFKKCYETNCRGYGNGKSMACIRNSNRVESFGVHFFKGEKIEIPPEEAVILHYESCDFEDWKWKFSQTNKPTHNFSFYKKSKEAIEDFNDCNHDKCEEILRQFYETQTGQMKTESIWTIH